MDAYIRQVCLALHLYPKPADFLDGLARDITGEKPWIALGDDDRPLTHDRRDVGRDRHTVNLTLFGSGCGLRPNPKLQIELLELRLAHLPHPRPGQHADADNARCALVC